jgi:hypothetical protein
MENAGNDLMVINNSGLYLICEIYVVICYEHVSNDWNETLLELVLWNHTVNHANSKCYIILVHINFQKTVS